MAFSLHIGRAALERLLDHAMREFPRECCGIIVGRRVGADTFVERVIEADNITPGDRGRSYQIDWKTLFAAVRDARDHDRPIVGFYHSHPDGSSGPSLRDQEHAWPGYSYVIIPWSGSTPGTPASWRCPAEGARLAGERVVIE